MKTVFVMILVLVSLPLGWGQDLTEPQFYEPLTVQQPTLEQLEYYLVQFPPFSDESVILPEHRQDEPFNWYETDAIHYVDLNNDDQLDLVAHSYMHIAVMVWIDGQYSQPFQLLDTSGHRNPYSKVTFEDWTFDDVPEVIFHERQIPASGTDIGGYRFKDTVIHCTESECHSIWDGVVFDNFNAYLVDGTWIQQTKIHQSLSEASIPEINTTTTEFVYGCVYACYLENDLPLPAGQHTYNARNRVGSTIQQHYRWNGAVFELESEKWLNEPYAIEISSQLEAVNNMDDKAKIMMEAVATGYAGQRFPQCQLFINDNMVGEPYFCDSANVTWQDITGDGHEELIVNAYAGFAGVQDGEKECAHQRLIAYQQSDEVFHQVANVTGCLVQIDLFGIHLENIDDDPALELVAAGYIYTDFETKPCYAGFCWYEPNYINDIYDWNGVEYIFSHIIPREPYQP